MKTLTAEEVFQKWSDIYHSGSGSGNAHDHHIKAMEEYASQFTQPPYGREVYEWVKASERLPENNNGSELFFIKYEVFHIDRYVESRGTARRYNNKWINHAFDETKTRNIEWLSRTTLPAQVEGEWINAGKDLPPNCTIVDGWNKNWIDEDFNPEGIRECFLQDKGGWVSARWNAQHDCWDNDEETSPTMWKQRFSPK